MLSSDPNTIPDSFVELVENGGEWFVRIVEGGRQTQLLIFEEEASARSYADGQRMRLRTGAHQAPMQSAADTAHAESR